jgi:hypothetical protein
MYSFCDIGYFSGYNMFINPTGTKLYIYSYFYLLEFTLSSAYDLSSIVFSKRLNLQSFFLEFYSSAGYVGGSNLHRFVYFKPDGKILYVGNYNDFFQFNLSSPWDISTIEYAGKIRFDPSTPFNQYMYPFCLSFEGG